ncbi:AMP-binding protein [Aquisalimonas lutea]|uniref:AMP-binding protein n=1 Tax=Aquisalimonas lutea TaxID=1327750 RepID=UPI0025B2E69B|nr:AMP-binding protein [Aquisalimonas lutea]MDN3517708.1 AMP-binding protein [Aquisalimonas lutea]
MTDTAKDPAVNAGKGSFEAYDARPWLKFYADSAPSDLDALPYTSFGDMVRRASREHAAQPAFTTCLPTGTTGTLSFAEVDRLSDAFAAYLRFELGLDKGDRVAIQSPNCLAYPVFLFGAAKAGCVIVNINPLYTVPEIDHALNDSGARLLLVINMFADKLPEVVPESRVEHVLVHSVAEFFPPLRRFIVQTVQKLKKMVPPANMAVTPLAQAIRAGERRIAAGDDVTTLEVGADDLLALQYTGGTTGRSKGAMLTHRNLLSNIQQSYNNLKEALPDERTAMTALPMYHIFALGVSGVFFSLGGHNVLIPSPRPVANLKPAFAKYDIRFFSGVNTLFNGLLAEDWFREAPPTNLAITIGGGTAVQNATARRWEEVVGHPIYQAYGLTETSPGVTSNPLNGPVKTGSIGIPYAGTYCRIVDEQDNPVPVGEPGELIVKGPQVMAGYWNRPDATEESMHNGWFHTGDIARMDEDGFFYIVDRKKDMVNVSGFNVYPNEVEDVIARHPGVREVGVVGVPDDETGEAVQAYVVKADDSVTEEAIREHCRQSLTGYKIPKRVIFREAIPLTPVGKVLRKDLRAEALRELGQD